MTKPPRSVRLTHIPTGVIVGVKSGAEQSERTEKAYRQLEKKLRKLLEVGLRPKGREVRPRPTSSTVTFDRSDVQLDIGSNFDVVEEGEE